MIRRTRLCPTRSMCRWSRLLVLATVTLGARTSVFAGDSEWTGAAGDGLWRDPQNWSTGAAPDTTTDVILGSAITPGMVLDASPPPPSFNEEVANSITITTPNSFTMTSALLGNSLDLTSGNLARPLGAGVGADQSLNLDIGLDANGTWNIGGAGSLSVRSIFTNGPSTLTTNFTKTGNGILFVGGLSINGAISVSQGTLRFQRLFSNTGVSISGGAELQLPPGAGTDSPVTLFGGTILFGGDGRLHSLGGNTRVGQLILSGKVNPVTVDSGTLTINGITDGTLSRGWNKGGAGTVALAGPGTYHGTTFINAGVVNAQRSDALGSGPVLVAQGTTLQLLPSTLSNTADVSIANPISLGGTLAGTGLFGNPQGASGPITLTANATVSGNLLMSGPMTDNGGGFSLTKTGDGTAVLSGANTVSGGFTVAQGVLRATVALPSGVPVVVQTNGTFELQNNVSINEPLQLTGPGYNPNTVSQNQPIGALLSSSGDNTWAGAITLQSDSSVSATTGASLTLSGPVSGGFALTKIGDGTLILTNANNSFSSLNISQGTVNLSSATPIPSGAPITVSVGAGLRVSGSSTFARSVNLNGSGSSFGAMDNLSGSNNWSGPVALQSDSTISATAGQLTISGNISGGFNLTKTGPGELVLAGNSSYHNTAVNQGVLTLASNGALGNGTTATVAAGATLGLNGNITSSATGTALLSGQGSAGQGALFNESGNNTFGGPVKLEAAATIGAAPGTTLTFSNQVSDDTMPLPLVKVGQGMLALTSANTYRGGTIVNAGALAINADAALGDPAGQVTLNNGGKLLITSNTTTARTYNLNTGSIQSASGITLTYNGATVSGGYLRGPGTHAIVGPANFSGVTALADSNIIQSAPTTLNNFTNSGGFANNAPLTWDGGLNTSAGVLTVNSMLNGSGFENNGTLTINNAGTFANHGNNLVSGGGSIVSVKTGGMLDVSANALNLQGALLVNNGTISGTTNVNYGSLAEGSGTFGQVNVTTGGAFHPGNSPGAVASSGAYWGAGGRYEFDVNDATGTGGTNWSLWNINGPLTISAGKTANSRFVISVNSLDASGNPGVAADFQSGKTFAWNIATYQSITGWSADEFTLDGSGLAGRSAQSMLGLTSDGQHVTLVYEGLPGDSNDDGAVGFDDLVTLARHYGQHGGVAEGDVNFDGTVGFDDLVILARRYGQMPTPAQLAQLPPAVAADVAAAFAQVPEPIVAGQLIALVTILQRRRDSISPISSTSTIDGRGRWF